MEYYLSYIIYVLVPLFLVLFYLLLRFLIKKYFNAQKSRMASKHYPLILSIGVLFASFITITSVWGIALELLIETLGRYGFKDINPPSQMFTGGVFLIFCVSIITLLYIHYKKYEADIAEDSLNKKDDFQKKYNISPPPEIPKTSPFFHERVKEMFESKYRNLELQYETETEILHGVFSKGINHYLFIIKCESTDFFKEINSLKTEKQLLISEKPIIEFYEQKFENLRTERYFIVEKGKINGSSNKVYFYNEDDFLLNLIDFDDYLKDIIHKFQYDRLPFSGRLKVDGHFTLFDTYIPPSYNDGELNLNEKLDSWVTESSQKHIAILGDYGTGKTSFLKYYSYLLAKEHLKKG